MKYPRRDSFKPLAFRSSRFGYASKMPRPSTTSAASSEAQDGEREKLNDQFRALMEGLRTTIPGVMVLFAFLLILPVQTSFGDFSDANQVVFYVAFLSAAIASVLLIAPSVHQRVRAPISGIERKTSRHVMFATKVAIAGTISFVVSIVAVVYLVTALVFTNWIATTAAVVLAGTASWAWFYLPLVSFDRDDE